MRPNDKDICDLKFWEGLAYMTPFEIKPSLYNAELINYGLKQSMLPNEYFNVKLDCYRGKVKGLNSKSIPIDIDYCLLDFKVTNSSEIFYECISKGAKLNFTKGICDSIYPLTIELGFWNLNATANI
jgi:hypothetical protein